MDYRTLMLWAMLASIVSGCASMTTHIPPWRTPGEKMLDPPEKIYQEYHCQKETLPFAVVEHSALLPRNLQLKIDKRLNHRLVYGLCSDNPSGEIVGRLYTRIYHRGRHVISDVDDAYVIKSGRWQVDTFITLLDDLETGVYILEIEFSNPEVDFKVENTFVVEP